MNFNWQDSVWQQYGAAIDMLDEAIGFCPDQLWTTVVWKDGEDARYGQFWCVAFHTLCWMELFLTGSEEGFVPPPPFSREDLPEQPYTKEQMRWYLDHCRSTCQSTIMALTEEQAQRRCVFRWMEPSFLELQLYSMRHVQEHAAQLSLVLGHHDVTGFDWIAHAKGAV